MAIALLLLLRGIYETFQLDVSFSVLGEGSQSLRVLLFSDLHAKGCHISKKKFRKAILSSPVDAFLFAGDMTCNRSDQEKALEFMAFFSALAKEANVPFYAILGNHDHYIKLNRQLSGLGIVLLHNQSISLKAADRSDWLLLGLEDLRIGNPSYESARMNRIKSRSPVETSIGAPVATSINFSIESPIETLIETPIESPIETLIKTPIESPIPYSEEITAESPIGKKSDDNFCSHVVLAHNPDSIFLLPDQSPHTVSPQPVPLQHPFSSLPIQSQKSGFIPPIFLLSGHFHGGQIWMPFHLEYRILRKEIMPKQGFRKGAYEKGGIIGYITRGLGCVIVPFRFFSYPEMSFLELRSSKLDSEVEHGEFKDET